LLAIAEVIRSVIGVACCEVLVPDGTPPRLARLARAGVWPDSVDVPASDASPWSLAAWVSEKREVAAERADGTKWIGIRDHADELLQWPPEGTEIRTLFVPLLLRERTVGVLCVSNATPFVLDPNRAQFLSALSYYAALGVERVQLVAEAERAEAFRQADTLKSALIAGLSHDLRTPLTTIKGVAHALRERGTTEAVVIEEEADRLNRLVADLLDLSRLTAGAMPMRPELNAAEDLIGAALRQVSGALGERRVVVTTSEPSLGASNGRPLLVGRFDFVQALRALVNLIENACKYSPPGERIDLSVERLGRELRFMVADRGPGIAAAEQERIFEPFYRAPGVPADVGGAGLGLAIARRLAAEQGGDVRYEPRPAGGSVFTLVLPAAEDADEPNDSRRVD
jgi:two-component system sensor histidine kinase KdpD